MKKRHVFQMLILLLFAAVLFACSKQVKEFTLTQDGNFSVYFGDGITTETKFEEGTKLIIRVKEERVPQNYMISEILINGVSNQPMYQYTITMDRNISLVALFKEIPVGLARVSFLGQFVDITPIASDNVYKLGTMITIKAPQYYEFSDIYINDVKIKVDAEIYEFEIKGETRINIERGSLIKVYEFVSVNSPDGLEIKIENASMDKYYKIGSEITLLAPENYSFTGSIYINNVLTPISGSKLKIEVVPKMLVNFNANNLIINAFKVELGEGLEIVGDQQSLYAHGSVVTVRAINNNGLNIIEKLFINNKEVEVNDISYDIVIDDDTNVTATFVQYSGECIEIQSNTAESLEIPLTAKVYSPSLNSNVFVLKDELSQYLAFQKVGTYRIRIDDGATTNYYLFDVKYKIEELKVSRNNFGFIARNEVIYVGYSNEFSIALEVVIKIPDLEEVGVFNLAQYTVRSNQVSNIKYTLEENGKDVTNIYLSNTEVLLFLPTASGRSFDLIMESEGIEIVQPIYVIEGNNVENKEDLKQSEINILQNNILFSESYLIDQELVVYGNYQSITFDTEDDYLFNTTATGAYVYLENVFIKGKAHNKGIINAQNSNVVITNSVLETAKYGIVATDTKVTSTMSKFQQLKYSNIALVVTNLANSELKLSSNVFAKTQLSSIMIIDKDDVLVVGNEVIVTNENNTFKNVKNLDLISQEAKEFLLLIDNTLVNEVENEANFAFYLDDGTVFDNTFQSEDIEEIQEG